MAILLSTARLDLREVVEADIAHLNRLNGDPEVMRYIGDGGVRTHDENVAAIQRFRRNYTLYPGLGIWAAIERRTQQFIGLGMLIYMPKPPEVQVGYRLEKSSWGHGYATEIGAALMKHAFDTVGLTRLVAVTHPDNMASQHVLTKIGLVRGADRPHWGQTVRYFSLDTAAAPRNSA